ncbi:MAG: ribonuclease E/G, partial [Ruminococcus sp.]|nr:ribonuclease E/G [Ruminococcus sp.]
MAQQIIIQQELHQMQAAIVEDGRLAEYYLQKDDASPAVGSIYRGIVESVLPGMQAAFVDIGWERSAYLALDDIVQKDDAACPNIGDILKAGQSLVVQIKKEAVDEKGPKVTTELSLQGRAMVLLPGKYQVNISKKITDNDKRRELKSMADSILLREDGHLPLGVIIRTAAEECSLTELAQEFHWLYLQWETLGQRINAIQKPGLIATDQHMAARIIRECAYEPDLTGIYVNNSALYEA